MTKKRNIYAIVLVMFIMILTVILLSCNNRKPPANTDTNITTTDEHNSDIIQNTTPGYSTPTNTLEKDMKKIQPIIDDSYSDALIAGIEDENIKLLISKKSMIASITDKKDMTNDNYVLDVDLLPGDSSSEWFGDIRFEYMADGRWYNLETRNLKNDRTVKTNGTNVCVVYNGISSDGENLKHFDLTERFSIADDSSILWEIIIDNPTDNSVTFGTVGFPLRFNTLQSENDFSDIYQNTFGIYGYIGGNASYYYVSRFNGTGRVLLFCPQGNTMIEYSNYKTYDSLNYPCVYVASEILAEDGKNASGISNTSFTLDAGCSVTISFKMKFAEGLDSIGDTLYEMGSIDVRSMPGMVIPTDQEATLYLNSKHEIKAVSAQYSSETEITESFSENGENIYNIKFSHLGENRLNITYGDGKICVVRYFVTEPFDTLITGVAEFISENQQQTDSDDPCYMGFLPWDMNLAEYYTKDGLLDATNWKSSDGSYSTIEWWHFGGDEMGMAPALYLSELNVYQPNETQIKQLADYCEIFLNNTMTEIYEDGTLHIHRGIPWNSMGEWPGNNKVDRVRFKTNYDCWRSYNYVHAINTYYNMYLISKYYDLDIDGLLEPLEYLDRCYKLMYTFFNYWMYPNNGTDLGAGGTEIGNMGESCFFRTLDALKEEGMTEEFETISEEILDKCKYFASHPYSFAGESNFLDTAAYEAVYAYAAYYGDDDLIEQITSANLGTRSHIPTWYLYGADIFGNNEKSVLLRYMTQLGGTSLIDYVINYSEDPASDIRIAYGSYNAGWAIVNSGYYSDCEANKYAVGWYFDQAETKYFNNDRNLKIALSNGLVGVSNEGHFGLWGGLLQACSVLVEDETLGLYCYGGNLTVSGDEYKITPTDGFGRRVYLLDGERRLQFVSYLDKIETFAADNKTGAIKAELSNSSALEHTEKITVKGIASGEYEIIVDGNTVNTVTAENGSMTVTFEFASGEESLVLEIIKVS